MLIVEEESYPEPKALSPERLGTLYERYGTFRRVAEVIGASEAFAQQNTPIRQRACSRKKKRK